MTTLDIRGTEDEKEAAGVRKDAVLNMTPAQSDEWIEVNINSLADTKAFLKKLTRLLRVMVRRGALK